MLVVTFKVRQVGFGSGSGSGSVIFAVNWWVTPVGRLPNCQENSTNQNYWLKSSVLLIYSCYVFYKPDLDRWFLLKRKVVALIPYCDLPGGTPHKRGNF